MPIFGSSILRGVLLVLLVAHCYANWGISSLLVSGIQLHPDRHCPARQFIDRHQPFISPQLPKKFDFEAYTYTFDDFVQSKRRKFFEFFNASHANNSNGLCSTWNIQFADILQCNSVL